MKEIVESDDKQVYIDINNIKNKMKKIVQKDKEELMTMK